MNDRPHHICRCLNRQFSTKEWDDYCKKHTNVREIVFQYGDFGFNICDVCLTPHVKVKWQGKHINKFEIETAQSPNGRWEYGYDYLFSTGGGIHAARFIADDSEGYPSEKEAVYAALQCLEHKAKDAISRMPDCEYDDETDTLINCAPRAANIRAALKEIGRFKEIYDPRQLNLFEL